MHRLLTLSLAAVVLSGCATAYVQWTKVDHSKPSTLADAETDCEFKVRQVAHTFGRYDMASVERFAFTCMASHGFSGRWVQR